MRRARILEGKIFHILRIDRELASAIRAGFSPAIRRFRHATPPPITLILGWAWLARIGPGDNHMGGTTARPAACSLPFPREALICDATRATGRTRAKADGKQFPTARHHSLRRRGGFPAVPPAQRSGPPHRE